MPVVPQAITTHENKKESLVNIFICLKFCATGHGTHMRLNIILFAKLWLSKKERMNA